MVQHRGKAVLSAKWNRSAFTGNYLRVIANVNMYVLKQSLKLNFKTQQIGAHLFNGVNVWLAVQAAYPPPLQGFVVRRL